MIDLCGGTGAWSKPYRDAGYDVRVITLPEYDVTDWRMYYDYGLVFPRITTEDDMLVPIKDVHGILAAPPCTEFSVAKGSRPRDLASGMEVVEACLRIIWHCRLHGRPKFWAMENPVGLLRQFLGKPVMTFQQWQFGDSGIKPTDLWGFFNPLAKTVKEKPDGLTTRFSRKTNGREWAKPECPPEYAHLNLDRASLRAITPPGFAQAFFKANP